ncbi:unnamed protein product [Cunninghamella blakesleeana]
MTLPNKNNSKATEVANNKSEHTNFSLQQQNNNNNNNNNNNKHRSSSPSITTNTPMETVSTMSKIMTRKHNDDEEDDPFFPQTNKRIRTDKSINLARTTFENISLKDDHIDHDANINNSNNAEIIINNSNINNNDIINKKKNDSRIEKINLLQAMASNMATLHPFKYLKFVHNEVNDHKTNDIKNYDRKILIRKKSDQNNGNRNESDQKIVASKNKPSTTGTQFQKVMDFTDNVTTDTNRNYIEKANIKKWPNSNDEGINESNNIKNDITTIGFIGDGDDNSNISHAEKHENYSDNNEYNYTDNSVGNKFIHCNKNAINNPSRFVTISPPPIKSTLAFNKEKVKSKMITIENHNEYSNNTEKDDMNIVINEFLTIIDMFFECIYNEKFQDLNFERIGHQCRQICQSGDSAQIYYKIQGLLKTVVQNICPILQEYKANSSDYLKHMLTTWESYSEKLNMVNELFNQFNHSYVIHSTKYSSLKQMGKQLYIEALLTNKIITQKTISSTVHILSSLRYRHKIDIELVHSILKLLYKDLCIYTELFEEQLLESIKDHYHEEAESKIDNLPVEYYLSYCIDLILWEIHCEKEILHHYIPLRLSSTEVAVKELLINHLALILLEFDVLIDNFHLLKVLYNFIYQYNAMGELQLALGDYIKATLAERLSNINTDDENFVKTCLQFRFDMYKVFTVCFKLDVTLGIVFKENFITAINNFTSSGKLLAAYFERALVSDENAQFNDYVKKGLDLFVYLQAKDVFKSYFRVILAKNLLMNSSSRIINNGRILIEKLKENCGNEYVDDLSKMIEDTRLSKKLSIAFEEDLSRAGIQSDCQLFVNILTSGYWPFNGTETSIYFSNQFSGLRNQYTKFYQHRYPHRKLTWVNSLGTCDMEANFPACSIKLKTSLYQATILLLFNFKNLPFWTCAQIFNAINIDKTTVKQELLALSTGRSPVLVRRTPNNKFITAKGGKFPPIDDSDRFSFNNQFTLQKARISSTSVLSTVHTPTELIPTDMQNVERNVLFERKDKIQALILRILKKHRRLNKEQLVNLMKFEKNIHIPIQNDLIINQLDDLVKCGYIKRDNGDYLLYSE